MNEFKNHEGKMVIKASDKAQLLLDQVIKMHPKPETDRKEMTPYDVTHAQSNAIEFLMQEYINKYHDAEYEFRYKDTI